MVSTLLALFLFVTLAYPQTLDDPPDGYHRLVGIPNAERIKAMEEAFFLEENSRIYNGKSIDIEKYPFFAGLQIYFKNLTSVYSACGASLVSSNRLLTVAHCWDDGHYEPIGMTVVLGSQFFTRGGLRIKTSQVFLHPQYNRQTGWNDIAVIYLPYVVNFTAAIFPTALPMGEDLEKSYDGAPAGAIGIGRTEIENEAPSNRSLRGVVVRIVSDSECMKYFQHRSPGVICTTRVGHKGPCTSDSGGPLITYTIRKILIGIIAANEPRSSCDAETPTAHSSVAYYLDFIQSNVILPNFTFRYEKLGSHNYEFITINDKGQYANRVVNEDYGMLELIG